jgi:hypothetical protein
VTVAAFRIGPMTAADARAVAAWKYPGDYSFYDADADADDLAELLNPAEWGHRYFAVDEELRHEEARPRSSSFTPGYSGKALIFVRRSLPVSRSANS